MIKEPDKISEVITNGFIKHNTPECHGRPMQLKKGEPGHWLPTKDWKWICLCCPTKIPYIKTAKRGG